MNGTLLNKILYTLFGGALFIIYTSPKTAEIGNIIFSPNGNLIYKNNCVTPFGHLLFTVLFFISLIVIKSLYNSIVSCNIRSDFRDVVRYSILATLVYYLVSNRELFVQVDDIFYKLFNVDTVDTNGCPTHIGTVLHTVVYLLLIFLFMSI